MPVIQNQPQPINLTQWVQELGTILQTIQPQNSQTAQLITYALLAAALVGILVYHYIKKEESKC